MVDMNLKLDNWKKRLLDLGKRNQLLNYRDTRRSNLRITKPEIFSLWDSFVVNEQPLEFPLADDEQVSGEQLTLLDGEDTAGVYEPAVLTNKSVKDQQATLRNLRNKARTIMEEQGVNVLYLSFGFLRWTEAAQSRYQFDSPLVLVPVTLSWESITAPFVLSLHEDEIVVNPTLAYKMENDFGIRLPELNADDGLSDYFDRLQNLVATQQWEVVAEVGLGLFSFLKINMYRDLERHRDVILSNPVIRTLSGDASAINHDLSFVDGFDHDTNTPPETTFQVVDADSSQQDAIVCAKQGVSFVLQGPPGTGKSQTITNIIAECLANGKKVLFVSEKMAALEVVHKRLKDAGLDDFCLILHSHKANKKSTLAQLGSVLNLASQKAALSEEAYQKLTQLTEDKTRLNDYAAAIFSVIEPLHKTIYDVNGELANLQDYDEIIFPISEVRQTTQQTYNSYILRLRKFADTISGLSIDYQANPWRDAKVEFVTNELRHDINAHLGSLIPQGRRVQEIYDAIGTSLEISLDTSYSQWEHNIVLLRTAAQAPSIPTAWVIDGDFVQLEQTVGESRQLQTEFLAQREKVRAIQAEICKVDPAADFTKFRVLTSQDEVQAHIAAIRTYITSSDPCYAIWAGYPDHTKVKGLFLSVKELIEEQRAAVQEISCDYKQDVFGMDYEAMYARFDSEYPPILKIYNEQYRPDRELVHSFCQDSRAVYSDAEIISILEELHRIAELKTQLGEANIAEYNSILQEITQNYERDIFSIDYNSLYLRFKTECTSALKIFNGKYRADKKLIQGLYRQIGKKFTDEEILTVLSQLRRLDELKAQLGEAYLEEYNSLTRKIGQSFEPGIFTIDYDGICSKFKAVYPSIVRTVTGQYQADKEFIQGLRLGTGEVPADEEVVALLTCLRRVAEIKGRLNEMDSELSSVFGPAYCAEKTDLSGLETRLQAYKMMGQCVELLKGLEELTVRSEAQEEDMRRRFGTLYCGLETDWGQMCGALDWAKQFREDYGSTVIPSERFLTYIFTSATKRELCVQYADKLQTVLSSFRPEFEWFLGLFQPADELYSARLLALTARMEDCLNKLASLEEWIDFRTARSRCYDVGLKEYIEQIDERNISAHAIEPMFKKRFFRLWLDSVLPEYPVVANFRHKVQEDTIRDFGQLDKLQFSIARSRIRSRLINGLPSLDHFTSGVDEVSVLKRELSKQRRIMPIRLLFKRIPNLILSLKPCLMMSPLSVSLFLESDAFMFDTVIFDEASQICTENAIGAILRGKQVIIAGDSKQLPPTNFFTANAGERDFDTDSDNEEEYDDTAGYESILDEAALLPERTLLWHYRSRHEHLIAFSNAKIYKNNLITFPSNVDRMPDIGVEYIYVPAGFYDRGGRKGNTIEAARVAELVFEHFRKFPKRSLGVIAFGEVQQMAIDTAIRKMRLEHQEFEPFFREDEHDAFFVKSLENVQGDERDTIIFSIGYAKDATGVMRMNFGPLSQVGGERRLNVAMTRAKYNVKLVGSIMPTDIDVDRVSADGPKLLRSYIDYAINGPSVLASEITEQDMVEHDSPFEAAVYNFLDRKGYKLATQVGCSGYRIDMAVKHPTLSGRYVLGIECDGASYHSARTARERDRLRQDVLESMGWKIYRIWSTDWIKDPITEGNRLVEAVDEAISSYVENFPEPIRNDEPEASTGPDEFITVEEKPVDVGKAANPYGFAAPVVTDFKQLPRDRFGYLKMTDCVELLVKNEYPIHYELLCQRLSPLLRREKATSVVRREVDYALRSIKDRVVRKGDFLYPADYTEIPVRQANGRPIKHISTDELAAALLLVLRQCVGTTRAALIDESTRAYGFNRRGANIASAMNAAYEQLVAEGKVTEVDGKVVMI